MKKINVFLMCICSLFFFTGCNTDEFEENGESNVSKDGAIETLKEVANFIDEQTDLEINAFQTNLLTWLKGNENVKETTIGENKDLITVKLKNGYDFYINFQDMAIFDDVDDTYNLSSRSSNVEKTEKDFQDVSFEKDEKIIEKNKILYIQGIDMFRSYADDEKEKITDLISKSPVDNKLVTVSKNLLSFLGENFADYGIIIVAQTHGFSDLKGAFGIEDIDFSEKAILANNKVDTQLLKDVLNKGRAITIYTKAAKNEENKYIIEDYYKESIFIIKPELISQKMANNDETIFYGNYCWSYGMAHSLKNTVYGYKTQMPYKGMCRDYLNSFLRGMLNGLTYEKTYPYISEPYYEYILTWPGLIKRINAEPNTNNNTSKQRYFSISTDEIASPNANGQPTITGKINGFKNLKKDELTYFVYFQEGDKDFSPNSAQCINITKSGIKFEDDGSFSFDFPDSLKANSKYRMAFAFKYKDVIYYGERKTVTTKEEEKIEEDDIRKYLEKLYKDTDGKHWTRSDNWCTDKPVEQWYGITLWGELRINLDNNNLNGSIDLSGCSCLGRFSCKNNNLVSIDVSGTKIKTFKYNNNNLTSLNVSGCTALYELYCYDNNLTTLDASGCTALIRLDCHDNNLTSLNISGCTALYKLYCSNNNLTSLNVSGFTALYELYCNNNNLTSLDASGCTALKMLDCENNHIKSEVPQDFDKLWFFTHDQLYDYYYDYKLSKTIYKENKYGWFYPGEPESLNHRRLSSSDAPSRQINKK